MSNNEFILALTLYAKAIPLRVLIMAAILTADKKEEKKLKKAFPDIWEEVQKRANLLDKGNDEPQ
jgi:protein-S-isoprenylcysteine O-methyltransferase Ste14